MVVALGVDALEEEAFDFVGRVEGIVFLGVEGVGVCLEHAAHVGGERRAVLIDDLAEDQDFAGTEEIGGGPVEGVPVHAEAEIALMLGGEAADGGAIEGEVVPALDEKLLVVIEHVEAAFEIAEEHGDGLDALGVREVLQAFLLNLAGGNALGALLLGVQIQIFQLLVGKFEKIAQCIGHGFCVCLRAKCLQVEILGFLSVFQGVRASANQVF